MRGQSTTVMQVAANNILEVNPQVVQREQETLRRQQDSKGISSSMLDLQGANGENKLIPPSILIDTNQNHMVPSASQEQPWTAMLPDQTSTLLVQPETQKVLNKTETYNNSGIIQQKS